MRVCLSGGPLSVCGSPSSAAGPGKAGRAAGRERPLTRGGPDPAVRLRGGSVGPSACEGPVRSVYPGCRAGSPSASSGPARSGFPRPSLCRGSGVRLSACPSACGLLLLPPVCWGCRLDPSVSGRLRVSPCPSVGGRLTGSPRPSV